MTTAQHDDQASDLPTGLSNPAKRALSGAGYSRLAQLSAVSESEIKKLHGMGPAGLKMLREALAAKGLSFKIAKAAGSAQP